MRRAQQTNSQSSCTIQPIHEQYHILSQSAYTLEPCIERFGVRDLDDKQYGEIVAHYNTKAIAFAQYSQQQLYEEEHERRKREVVNEMLACYSTSSSKSLASTAQVVKDKIRLTTSQEEDEIEIDTALGLPSATTTNNEPQELEQLELQDEVFVDAVEDINDVITTDSPRMQEDAQKQEDELRDYTPILRTTDTQATSTFLAQRFFALRITCVVAHKLTLETLGKQVDWLTAECDLLFKICIERRIVFGIHDFHKIKLDMTSKERKQFVKQNTTLTTIARDHTLPKREINNTYTHFCTQLLFNYLYLSKDKIEREFQSVLINQGTTLPAYHSAFLIKLTSKFNDDTLRYLTMTQDQIRDIYKCIFEKRWLKQQQKTQKNENSIFRRTMSFRNRARMSSANTSPLTPTTSNTRIQEVTYSVKQQVEQKMQKMVDSFRNLKSKF